MPVPKENTIDTTWVHNRDVTTSNASSVVLYRKVLSYLKQRSMVLICSCGANHSYTVLLCIDLWGSLAFVPWCSPTLSMWTVSKPDVWFFVSFRFFGFFCLICLEGFFFCLFWFFVQAFFFFLLSKPHTVFILTAHSSSNSEWFFLGGLSLSQKMTPQSLLYLFCICEMFK